MTSPADKAGLGLSMTWPWPTSWAVFTVLPVATSATDTWTSAIAGLAEMAARSTQRTMRG